MKLGLRFLLVSSVLLCLWIGFVVPRLVASPPIFPPRIAPENPGDYENPWEPQNPIENSEVVHLQVENRRLRRQLAGARRRFHSIIYGHPFGMHPLDASFLCIHSYEGAWNDPNAPYWGGIQMDVSFMRTYMPWAYRAWGTADHWPVSVQIAAGIHAVVAGRGFHPWPNTARYCGLL